MKSILELPFASFYYHFAKTETSEVLSSFDEEEGRQLTNPVILLKDDTAGSFQQMIKF